MFNSILYNPESRKFPLFYLKFSSFFFFLFIIDLIFSPSIFILFLGLIGFSYYLIVFYNKEPKLFFLSILLVIGFYPTVISNALNEIINVYLPEINQTSYLNGSTITNIFFISVFFLSSRLGYSMTNKNYILGKVFIPFHYLNGARFIFLIILVFLIVLLFIYNSPLFLGVDRLYYRNKIIPFPIQFILNLSNSLLYFMAIFLFYSRIKSIKFFVILFLYGLVLVLHGDRFSGLFFGFSIIVITLSTLKQKFPSISQLKYYFLGALVLVCCTLMINLISTGYSDEVAFSRNLIRFSLQSEVWWASQNIITYYPNDLSLFFENVLGLGAPSSSQGMNYMMKLLAPENIYNSYLDKGAKFTMGFPSILLVTLGFFLGGVAIIFFGLLIGFVQKKLVISTTNSYYVSGFFILKIYLLLTYAFTMGDLQKIFSIHFLLYGFLALVCSSWKFSFKDKYAPHMKVEF